MIRTDAIARIHQKDQRSALLVYGAGNPRRYWPVAIGEGTTLKRRTRLPLSGFYLFALMFICALVLLCFCAYSCAVRHENPGGTDDGDGILDP